MVSSLIKKFGNTLSLNKGTKISGQTVLITGGTSGMGLIMAKECAKRGASAIIIWDIARLDETVATLEGLGVKAGGYKVNVADVENVNAQAEQTLKDFGKVDILDPMRRRGLRQEPPRTHRRTNRPLPRH